VQVRRMWAACDGVGTPRFVASGIIAVPAPALARLPEIGFG
jgi:hypothetical protein